jgi:hypothetical protein
MPKTLAKLGLGAVARRRAALLLRISLEGNYFNTDGYDVVKSPHRGSIDIEADSNHSTFNGRVELLATPEAAGRSAAASAQFDNGELRFAAYARRKRLTSPEPSTRICGTWLRMELGVEP